MDCEHPREWRWGLSFEWGARGWMILFYFRMFTKFPRRIALDVINKSHWDHKVGDPPFKARKKCWHQMIVATHDVMERNFRCSFEWPITNLMIGPVSTWIFCSPRLRTGAQKKSELQICLALNSRWPTLWFAFVHWPKSYVLNNRPTKKNTNAKPNRSQMKALCFTATFIIM